MAVIRSTDRGDYFEVQLEEEAQKRSSIATNVETGRVSRCLMGSRAFFFLSIVSVDCLFLVSFHSLDLVALATSSKLNFLSL